MLWLAAAGEDEGRGSCHDDEGELHAWEWIDVDGVVVVVVVVGFVVMWTLSVLSVWLLVEERRGEREDGRDYIPMGRAGRSGALGT